MAQSLKLQLEILVNGSGKSIGELQKIKDAASSAAKSAAEESKASRTSLGASAAQVAELAFRYNNVVGAIQNLVATARPAYDLLIGSNERLNQQILSVGANLASASRISIGGNEITDPTAKIKATESSVRAALKQIEIDTQSLVGVTSQQVNELFEITLTNASVLANQSKQFPDAISAATTLTKGWAASLQVVGVPLAQARQEITSILTGQIDQNSKLAKTLKITSDQVRNWQSQGVLVDKLNEKLQVFVAGNAIAARSIGGISSNIQDLVERLAREAGAPFLEPIISALAAIEKYLKENEQAIQFFFKQFTDAALATGASLADVFGPLAKDLLSIATDLGPIALAAFKGLSDVIVGLGQVIAPVARLLTATAAVIADLAASPIGQIAVETIVVTAAIAALIPIIEAFALVSVAGYTGMAAFGAAALITASTVGALVVALGPLAALVGLLAVTAATNELEDTNEALEAYGDQVLQSIDAVASLGSELKKLDAIRKAGGVLTAEQIAREKQLNASAAIQLESINAKIKALKELKVAESQESNRKGQIATLEAQAKKIQEVTGGLVLQANALEDLGKTQELSDKRLAQAKTQVKSEGNGSSADFAKATKEVISLAKERAKLGEATAEASAAEVLAIKNNTKAELATRRDARDAIIEIYDSRIAKIKELIEVDQLQSDAGLEELAKIRDNGDLEPKTRRKAAQEIIGIRKEQIAAETAEITAGQAKISAAQAQQRLGEAAADKETTSLKLAELDKRSEATKVSLANSTNDTERRKLTAELEQGLAEREKTEAEFLERGRKRAIEDFDERRNLLKTRRDLGQVSQSQSNAEILANDTTQFDLQIQQLQDNLAKLAKTDTEGRGSIASKVAEIESKKEAAQKNYFEEAIKLSNTNAEQVQKVIQTAYEGQLISEDEYYRTRADNALLQADNEIVIQRQKLARLGEADTEGRNAIAARIAELQSKRIGALDQFYQAELEQIKRYQAQANQLLTQAETERQSLIQISVNRQLSTVEKTEQAKLTSQRKSLNDQLALAKEQENAIDALSDQTRSADAERAYQIEVQAARANTAQFTLKILEQEGQQIQFNRGLAIDSIESQLAAQNRLADAQLGNIASVSAAQARASKSAEAVGDREANAIDRISKSLELQKSLYEARLNLTRAIQSAQSTAGDIEGEKVKSAIELTKQLQAGNLSYREQEIIQKRLVELTGSNSKSIYELTLRQSELEKQAAQRKQQALLFEQEQARSQLILEQKKNDLATQRSVIEAKIAEIKAKQSLLDAQTNLQQSRLNDQKTIQAAQGDLGKAKQQAPGLERDRSVADAESKLALAKQQAITNQSNGQQSIDLARQQVDFVSQT
jgi:hypothetical protein